MSINAEREERTDGRFTFSRRLIEQWSDFFVLRNLTKHIRIFVHDTIVQMHY